MKLASAPALPNEELRRVPEDAGAQGICPRSAWGEVAYSGNLVARLGELPTTSGFPLLASRQRVGADERFVAFLGLDAVVVDDDAEAIAQHPVQPIDREWPRQAIAQARMR
jgi:hypothetical protein